MSEHMLYTWRKKNGDMDVVDAKRLKSLESENNRLKKLLAKRDLEIEVMKEVAAKNGERAGGPAAGRVRASSRPVVSTWVRAAVGRTLIASLRPQARKQRCCGPASKL